MLSKKPASKKRSAPVSTAAPAVARPEPLWTMLSKCGRDKCALCVILRIVLILFFSLFIYWLGLVYGSIAAPSAADDVYVLTPEMHKVIIDRAADKKMSHQMSEVSMEQMMGDMTAALAGKTGEEFDKEFLIQMIIHHEGALEMARLALERSDNAAIRDLAERIIANQTAEIVEMQNITR